MFAKGEQLSKRPKTLVASLFSRKGSLGPQHIYKKAIYISLPLLLYRIGIRVRGNRIDCLLIAYAP